MRKDFDIKLAAKNETASSDNKSVEERFNAYRAKMEDASIARQLQKLFVRLQMSDARAVETRDLTKSFGWTGAVAFNQHDVQVGSEPLP